MERWDGDGAGGEEVGFSYGGGAPGGDGGGEFRFQGWRCGGFGCGGVFVAGCGGVPAGGAALPSFCGVDFCVEAAHEFGAFRQAGGVEAVFAGHFAGLEVDAEVSTAGAGGVPVGAGTWGVAEVIQRAAEELLRDGALLGGAEHGGVWRGGLYRRMSAWSRLEMAAMTAFFWAQKSARRTPRISGMSCQRVSSRSGVRLRSFVYAG